MVSVALEQRHALTEMHISFDTNGPKVGKYSHFTI